MRAFVFLFSLLTLAACSPFWSDPDDPAAAEVQFDGTVTYTELEGGAWVIRSDAGETYEPLGLASAYEQEGLRVRVWGEVVDNAASILMVGPILQIERVERL